MKIKNLKVGDNLYKHGTFVGAIKYVITSIDYDLNHIELECLSCSDHPNCKLVAHVHGGNIVFKKMLNNPDQEYWHKSESKKEQCFYRSYKEYAHCVSAISIGESITKIKEYEKALERLKKEKQSYIDWLKKLDEKGYGDF